MRKSIALLAVGMLATLTTVTHAANKEDTFSVSPVVGGMTYDGRQHLETSPVFGGRAGYNFTKRIGIEALFDFSRTRSTLTTNNVDIYRYGGELLYHFFPDDKLVPYLAAGYSGINMVGKIPFVSTEKTKGTINYGLGFKYFVTEDIAWRGDVRHLMYDYDRYHHTVEYTVGLYIPFGGTKQASMKLPDPPPPPPPVVRQETQAQPLAPITGLSASPARVTKGESATLNWTSLHAKNCDIAPGVGNVDLKGSASVTPGSDTLYTLTCRGDGGVAKSTASVAVIVPPQPAPPQPEPKPEPPPVVESAQKKAAAQRFCDKPAILKINFDTDKADIKPEYHNELKSVGDFLQFFPQARGEISGHTDHVASQQYNQKLSERRANSVKSYIVEKFGISSDRITTKGYGKLKPIATNKTKEGRAKNRRIEAFFNCE